MKKHFYILILLALLGNIQASFSQCLIPNKDFSGYWLVVLYANGAESFDPEDWLNNWESFQNPGSYKGVYTYQGSTGPYDAVQFYLGGPNREVGIITYHPIFCTNFPTSVTGHFKHLLGDGSDTLLFKIHLSEVDVWGDTTREVPTAELISSTDISSAFQPFEISMPLPHLNTFTQIDSIEVTFKSKSLNPGSFILDDLDFGYTISSQESGLAQRIRISPTITDQNIHISLPAPMPGLQITLVDTRGSVVFSTAFNAEETLDLNLESLAAGVYFIQGNCPKEQIHFTRKFVKIGR